MKFICYREIIDLTQNYALIENYNIKIKINEFDIIRSIEIFLKVKYLIEIIIYENYLNFLYNLLRLPQLDILETFC